MHVSGRARGQRQREASRDGGRADTSETFLFLSRHINATLTAAAAAAVMETRERDETEDCLALSPGNAPPSSLLSLSLSFSRLSHAPSVSLDVREHTFARMHGLTLRETG